jgi:UDP-glucose 4-epimerase
VTLADSISRLVAGLRGMEFRDDQFRTSNLIRLQVLRNHIQEKRLSQNLEWIGAR